MKILNAIFPILMHSYHFSFKETVKILNTSPTASVCQLRNDVELPTIQSKAILLQMDDVIQSDVALHLQAHKNG